MPAFLGSHGAYNLLGLLHADSHSASSNQSLQLPLQIVITIPTLDMLLALFRTQVEGLDERSTSTRAIGSDLPREGAAEISMSCCSTRPLIGACRRCRSLFPLHAYVRRSPEWNNENPRGTNKKEKYFIAVFGILLGYFNRLLAFLRTPTASWIYPPRGFFSLYLSRSQCDKSTQRGTALTLLPFPR